MKGDNDTARETMLNRIRTALRDVPKTKQKEEDEDIVERSYLHSDPGPREEIIERFIERVADYKAIMRRVKEDSLPAAIATSCEKRGVQRLVVPSEMPASWLPEDIDLLRDEDQALTYEQLDQSDGMLTGCALGIAQTGTIVLGGGKMQGRRVLTLLPDYMLCLIWEEQIVGLVPEAITQLDQIAHAGKPITFISGPSATSDIELSRVEGVHGPRTLEVFVVERM